MTFLLIIKVLQLRTSVLVKPYTQREKRENKKKRVRGRGESLSFPHTVGPRRKAAAPGEAARGTGFGKAAFSSWRGRQGHSHINYCSNINSCSGRRKGGCVSFHKLPLNCKCRSRLGFESQSEASRKMVFQPQLLLCAPGCFPKQAAWETHCT